MKYIKVTHIESGNEEFYVISNISTIQKQGDIVHINCNIGIYSSAYDTKKYDIQEVNNLF